MGISVVSSTPRLIIDSSARSVSIAYGGIQGPEGPQGLQGIQGVKGDKGDTGTGYNVFANSAARDAAIPTPVNGDHAYLQDTNTMQVYDGSSWDNYNVRLLSAYATVTVNSPNTASLILNGGDGPSVGDANLVFKEDGTTRWIVGFDESDDHLHFLRYNGAGVLQDSPIEIDGATGLVTISGEEIVTPQSWTPTFANVTLGTAPTQQHYWSYMNGWWEYGGYVILGPGGTITGAVTFSPPSGITVASGSYRVPHGKAKIAVGAGVRDGVVSGSSTIGISYYDTNGYEQPLTSFLTWGASDWFGYHGRCRATYTP